MAATANKPLKKPKPMIADVSSAAVPRVPTNVIAAKVTADPRQPDHGDVRQRHDRAGEPRRACRAERDRQGVQAHLSVAFKRLESIQRHDPICAAALQQGDHHTGIAGSPADKTAAPVIHGSVSLASPHNPGPHQPDRLARIGSAE